MARGDMSNEQWAKIGPLLPPEHSGKKGHPYVSHRRVINGILWRIRTGAGWRDIPERYGPHQTCYDRFVRFKRSGLWQLILQALQAAKDKAHALDWHTGCADGSVIRAHQHAAGAAAASSLNEAELEVVSARANTWPTALKEQVQQREALGYSQGGFSTKIHLVCDGKGRPLAATLSGGQAHESKHLASTLDAIRVPRVGKGRPKKRPG
jgi:transposase